MRTIWPASCCGSAIWESSTWALTTFPEYESGSASSPILYEDKVIVQCDQQRGSFLEAFDSQTGADSLENGARRTALLGHAGGLSGRRANRTGYQRFKFRPGIRSVDGQRTVASGRKFQDHRAHARLRRWPAGSGQRAQAGAPIFAIRAGAIGDITGKSRWVAWRSNSAGHICQPRSFTAAISTVLGNAGVFDCYNLATGAEIYRERIPHQGSGFSGSPVASDRDLPAERRWRRLRGQSRPAFRVVAEERNGRAFDGQSGNFRRHAAGAHPASFMGDRCGRDSASASAR